MKAAILYSSQTQIGDAILVISHPTKIYVRHEIVEVDGLMHALDKAKPLAGETVLNSIEVPE
jgi:hypothetical protein